MAARWSDLTAHLRKQEGDRVTLSWGELDRIVGGMPASSIDHPAWWSGDRPQTRAWTAAGFRVDTKRPGVGVTFVRSMQRPSVLPARVTPGPSSSRNVDPSAIDRTEPDVLLVTCVKTKSDRPSPAKELYRSPLFLKERQYAERLAVPWFILSAEYGLVAPDEWLSPYERYLPDTPPSYREAWGAWAVERLALHVGGLQGKVVEVHASREYLDAIRGRLESRGAVVTDPLAGLSMGQRLSWYDGEWPRPSSAPVAANGEVVERYVGLLLDEASAMSPAQFLSLDRSAYLSPGLYSWWVDAAGAADLSRGLGYAVRPGLVYAGLAGATRWPSGRRSTNTLWERIAGMHLGKKHEFSTFRLTLGSVLAQANVWPLIDEPALTAWMHDHLRVVAHPVEDADTLGRLESQVLARLDPPLNLQGMAPTPIRKRLTELRRLHGNRSRLEDRG